MNSGMVGGRASKEATRPMGAGICSLCLKVLGGEVYSLQSTVPAAYRSISSRNGQKYIKMYFDTR